MCAACVVHLIFFYTITSVGVVKSANYEALNYIFLSMFFLTRLCTNGQNWFCCLSRKENSIVPILCWVMFTNSLLVTISKKHVKLHYPSSQSRYLIGFVFLDRKDLRCKNRNYTYVKIKGKCGVKTFFHQGECSFACFCVMCLLWV